MASNPYEPPQQFAYFIVLLPIGGIVSLPVFVGIGCICREFFPVDDGYDSVYRRIGPMLTFLASVSIGCLGIGLFVFIFMFLLA